MTFKSMLVRNAPEEVQAASGWTTAVYVTLDDAPPVGFPFRVQLGNQPVEGIAIVRSFKPILTGYLKSPPALGDELVIVNGEETFPTGLTVGALPLA